MSIKIFYYGGKYIMKTNNFLGRDWIDAELDFSKEEW